MTEKWTVKICWTGSVWPKWQVVIPKEVRDIANIHPWDKVIILLRNNRFVWILKADDLQEVVDYAKSVGIKIE